ncbi:MAG: hypothetical protein ABIU54_02890 [Candidatus Eisenbacteria bacterium]
MHRFSQYRWWKVFLALCLCAGALSASSISRADSGDEGTEYLRGPDIPPPLGAGDPDIPQTRTGAKPGADSGRSGAGIYRNSAPVEGVVSHSNVWMIRFHAAARLWAAYFVRR